MTAYPANRPMPAARQIRSLVKPFDPDRRCGLVVNNLVGPNPLLSPACCGPA
jgi:hypothetical protein